MIPSRSLYWGWPVETAMVKWSSHYQKHPQGEPGLRWDTHPPHTDTEDTCGAWSCGDWNVSSDGDGLPTLASSMSKCLSTAGDWWRWCGDQNSHLSGACITLLTAARRPTSSIQSTQVLVWRRSWFWQWNVSLDLGAYTLGRMPQPFTLLASHDSWLY